MGENLPDYLRVNPNPRVVALLNYALDQVVADLRTRRSIKGLSVWLAWAQSWKEGERLPALCVDVGRHYLHDEKTHPLGHVLGQLAWAGKEACYSTPTSGWLVIRYVADAMVAFGVAFPDGGFDHLIGNGTTAALPAREPAAQAAREGGRHAQYSGRGES